MADNKKKTPAAPTVDTSAPPMPTPDIRMLMRTPTATLVCNLARDGKSIEIVEKKEKAKKVFCNLVDTADGKKLPSITLYNAENVLVTEDGKMEDVGAVHSAELSPKASFLVTWTKPQDLIMRKNTKGADREILLKLTHKKPPSGEPLIQFNKSENFACYQVANEVKVWDTRKREDKKQAEEESQTIVNIPIVFRIRAEGLASYSLCPDIGGGTDEVPPVIATFQVGKSGMPSTVSLFAGETKIAFANTFRADYCTYKWSTFCPGDVLAKLETSVDATGQSYYGESKLVLLSAARKEALDVVCGKEGAVHDFAWSPKRHVFVVVAGKSPARCTMYDGKTADPLVEFGESHKNIACFSPSGRFLCLAGFGNLAGGMDFWDVKRSKLMGSGKADAAVGFGWSPCGRMFMTATLAPRMNVDNGVTIYSYRGVKLAHIRADDPKSVLGADGLLECRFMPVPEGSFPDLPASPKEGEPSAAKAGAAGGNKSAPAQPVKKDVYRPPGASGGIVGLKQQSTSAPKPAQQNNPPTAKKEAASAPKKVEKKEQKKAGGQEPNKGKANNNNNNGASSVDAVDADEEGGDPEKLIRKFKKLLRQIEEIEQKGGPKDENQKTKLLRKKEVEDKLRLLEANVNKPA